MGIVGTRSVREALPAHALAASAAIRHDVPRAREHYRQIIAINPTDETAKHYLAEQAGE